MPTIARTLRLFALILWIGGIVHFGAVFAPVAAHALNTIQLGAVIGPALARLHFIGILCGVAILISLRILGRRAFQPVGQMTLAVAMIVLTLVSNRYLLQPMEHIRQETNGYLSAFPTDAPIRRDFDNRHHWSTRVEGAVLLCGVGLALLVAFEQDRCKEE